jgi:hypothetical protein
LAITAVERPYKYQHATVLCGFHLPMRSPVLAWTRPLAVGTFDGVLIQIEPGSTSTAEPKHQKHLRGPSSTFDLHDG